MFRPLIVISRCAFSCMMAWRAPGIDEFLERRTVKVLLVILMCVSSCCAAEEKMSRGCVDVEKDINRHEEFMKHKEELLAKGPIDLVFIGDSITDGWRWGGGQAVLFEKQWSKYNPYNIG